MKKRRKRGPVKNVIFCGSQVWVQRLQNAKNGCDVCIFISNGFTSKCQVHETSYMANERNEPDISMFRNDAEILVVYYQDTCEGLECATKELEEFVCTHSVGKKLWLIGYSKSADSQNDIREFAIENGECDSIDVVFVSPALEGSFFADKEVLSSHVKRFGFGWMVKLLWDRVFNNIPVETDISPNSEYVKKHANVKREVTRSYISYLPPLAGLSVRECIAIFRDEEGVINVFLNWVMGEKSDGIVEIKNQFGNVPLDVVRMICSTHCHALEKACKELCKEFPYLSKY